MNLQNVLMILISLQINISNFDCLRKQNLVFTAMIYDMRLQNIEIKFLFSSYCNSFDSAFVGLTFFSFFWANF